MVRQGGHILHACASNNFIYHCISFFIHLRSSMVYMLYTLGFELIASDLRNDIKLLEKSATIRKLDFLQTN
jgi:hypothetical protein